MDEVNKFISKFHAPEDTGTIFTSEVCYWFAYILYRRFIRTDAVLMYASSGDGDHFATKIHGRVYDITGDVTDKFTWEPWLEFKDRLEKERIVRDCIMF